MKRLPLALIAGFALALLPMAVYAQDGDERGFLLRFDGDVTIARDEVAGSVVVINGDATIDGTVKDTLIVIEGTAIVRGSVEGDVTVVSGDLDLRSGATVKNVHLVRSDLTQASGATITGDLNRRENFAFRGFGAVFSILIWVGMTIAVVAAGILFAAVGGRQLKTASLALTQEVGQSILGAVIVWVGVPVAAVLIIITVVGIPLGLGMLLFLLPTLWVLGYIALATRLGMALVGYAGRIPGDHPYAAVAVGLIVLQLLVLVPVLGFLIVGVGALWGAGGIALVAYRAARGGPETPGPAAPAGQPA
jgi:cytoskeletal protein CcmA (bactofilin family)